MDRKFRIMKEINIIKICFILVWLIYDLIYRLSCDVILFVMLLYVFFFFLFFIRSYILLDRWNFIIVYKVNDCVMNENIY